MLNKNKARQLSTREMITYSKIQELRNRATALDLNIEFNETILIPYYESNHADNNELIKTTKECVNNLKSKRDETILELEFYKKKRSDFIAKKAMKDYDKYPKNINLEELERISEE